MNIIWNILGIAFPLMVTAISWKLYGRRRLRMARFRLSMIEKRSTRKVYLHALLFILLIFHFVYTCTHMNEFGVLPSTILIAVMYRFKLAERLMHLLNRNRLIFIAASLLSIALALIPHLYTLGMTVAFLLLASMFYPSKFEMERYGNALTAKLLRQTARRIATLCNLIISYVSHDNVDSGDNIRSTQC